MPDPNFGEFIKAGVELVTQHGAPLVEAVKHAKWPETAYVLLGTGVTVGAIRGILRRSTGAQNKEQMDQLRRTG